MLPYYAYTTEGNEGLEPFLPSLETFSPVRCRMSRMRNNGCKGRCYGNRFRISIRSKREPTPYHLEWSRYAILMAVYEQDSLVSSGGFAAAMVADSAVRQEEEGLVERVADREDASLAMEPLGKISPNASVL